MAQDIASTEKTSDASITKSEAPVGNELNDPTGSPFGNFPFAVEIESTIPQTEHQLGMVASLFTTLRYRDPSTAAHSLRVAMGCSYWAAALKMPEKLRVQFETAALLHDIGKMSLSDKILKKPSPLTGTELEEVDHCPVIAKNILSSSGVSKEIIDGVFDSNAWYDGTHRSNRRSGSETSVIARMISIVDAFDSMTNNQVYRSTKSTKDAIEELYNRSGTQFDKQLVTSFIETLNNQEEWIKEDVANRWLVRLDLSEHWEQSLRYGTADRAVPQLQSEETFFQQTLTRHSHEAIAFVDLQSTVTFWNEGAERLTGLGANAVCGKRFSPEMFKLGTKTGFLVTEEKCPVQQVLRTKQQHMDRYEIWGRAEKYLNVDLQVIPVLSNKKQFLGVVLTMRDVSSEASLEEKCQSLQNATTKDPMTQVANRAEFDRMLQAYLATHQEAGMSFCLVMADIDHFKRVNDDYGHQAGDQVILAFAGLLKSQCRSGDLVARYGGEEFAILCADCDLEAAMSRAEQLRRSIAEMIHSQLGSKNVTASFGVTELEPKDTPETILKRADQALYIAKEQGRNQVVHQSSKNSTFEDDTTAGNLLDWILGARSNRSLIETTLISKVPIELVIGKLKGFISEKDARITIAKLNHLCIEVYDSPKSVNTGRSVTFVIDLRLSQEKVERESLNGLAAGKRVQTRIEIKILTKRDRDRRRGPVTDRARLLFGNLQSYLMADDAKHE